MNEKQTTKLDSTWWWLMVAIWSMGALVVGELFEQIVFVPNWLIGDIAQNVESFRQFKHVTDPGVFYFPVTFIVLAAHIVLLRKSVFTRFQKNAVRTSLLAVIIVYALTIYIIMMINTPVFDKPGFPDDQLSAILWQWAILNVFRFILPAYGVFKLCTLLRPNTTVNVGHN